MASKNIKKKAVKKMKFRAYVDSIDMTQEEIAKKLGKARCTVNRWYNGVTRPILGDAKAIVKWSKNRCQLSEWNYS